MTPEGEQFYAEMAGMTTELLTIYGKPMKLVRDAGSGDPTLGTWTPAITEFDTIGAYPSLQIDFWRSKLIKGVTQVVCLNNAAEPQLGDLLKDLEAGTQRSIVGCGPIIPATPAVAYFAQLAA